MQEERELDIYFYVTGWICTGVLVVVLAGMKIFGEGIFHLVPRCFFHTATGYYCPGCGGTRAVFALLKGHFLKSLFYHPFVGYTMAIGGWFMCSQTIEHLSKGKAAVGLHFRQVYMWIGIILIVINFLVKNGVLLFWKIPLLG